MRTIGYDEFLDAHQGTAAGHYGGHDDRSVWCHECRTRADEPWH